MASNMNSNNYSTVSVKITHHNSSDSLDSLQHLAIVEHVEEADALPTATAAPVEPSDLEQQQQQQQPLLVKEPLLLKGSQQLASLAEKLRETINAFVTAQLTPVPTPCLPLPKDDEYDIVVPLLHNRHGCFSLYPNKQGQTVFLKYVQLADGTKGPAELHNLFRNHGDVFLAVDRVSTEGKSYAQVKAMIQTSCRENRFVCLRMRDMKRVAAAEQSASNQPLSSQSRSLSGSFLSAHNNNNDPVLDEKRVTLETEIAAHKDTIAQLNDDVQQLNHQMEAEQEELDRKVRVLVEMQKDELKALKKRAQELKQSTDDNTQALLQRQSVQQQQQQQKEQQQEPPTKAQQEMPQSSPPKATTAAITTVVYKPDKPQQQHQHHQQPQPQDDPAAQQTSWDTWMSTGADDDSLF